MTRSRSRCRVCQRPFRRARYRDLHLGHHHPEDLTRDERARFEAAVAAEDAWLATFQRHVRGLLACLPVLLSYAFLLISLYAFLGTVGFGYLLFPGVMAFAALTYYLGFTSQGRGRPGA